MPDADTLKEDRPADRVRKTALGLGFDLAGIAPAGAAPHAGQFLDWLEQGYAGEMGYMARSADQRADTRVRFPWARSIVCVGLRYPGPPAARACTAADSGGAVRSPRISCYAQGADYHGVMARPLAELEAYLKRNGATRTKAYVDTGPVLERDWAALAGLGWIGKNTVLINEGLGSWLFLGVLLTDLKLEADEPAPGRCGTCTDCIDACPTGALLAPYLLDSRLCISYLTIELKGAFPAHLRAALGDWVFGCDVCQSVCPWNSRALRSKRTPRSGPDPHFAFAARPELAGLDLGWALANPDALSKIIEGTAVERARGERLTRNLIIAAGNSGDSGLAGALAPYAVSASSGLAEQTGWAMKRLHG